FGGKSRRSSADHPLVADGHDPADHDRPGGEGLDSLGAHVGADTVSELVDVVEGEETVDAVRLGDLEYALHVVEPAQQQLLVRLVQVPAFGDEPFHHPGPAFEPVVEQEILNDGGEKALVVDDTAGEGVQDQFGQHTVEALGQGVVHELLLEVTRPRHPIHAAPYSSPVSWTARTLPARTGTNILSCGGGR